MTATRPIETHTLPLADELAPWFAGHENEYDMPAIYDQVRDELQDQLDRHDLGILSAWPPEHPADLWAPVAVDADQARDLLRQALEDVDLQTIAERHAQVRATPLPACPDRHPIVVREDRRRTLTIEFVSQSIAIMDRWSDDEADPDPLWLTPSQAEDLAAALVQATVTARQADL